MRRLLMILAICGLPTLSMAQNTAGTLSTLVADRLDIIGDQIIASGNVQIWQGTQMIEARKLVYDRTADRIELSGPIKLQDADGTTILASAAELSLQQQTALLQDARMVMEDRLQLAAVQIARPNQNITSFFKAAATSCYVCKGGVPIWQIRARRVVHNADEKMLYLDHAHLRIMDIPVLYVPWMRLPDPSLDRATGFMQPQIRSSTLLGTGLALPFFITLGDHRDIEVAPYVSPRTNSLEYKYRQAFVDGNLTVEGAFSDDDIEAGRLRAYVFADGTFKAPYGFTLDFDLRTVNDKSYLIDYGYSNADRLHSFAALNRSERARHDDLSFSHYYSLRQSEDNATLPTLVIEGTSQRRFAPASIGGTLNTQVSFLSSYRYSDLDVDGPDADTEVDGYDFTRISLDADWSRNWTLPNGMIAGVGGLVGLDAYYIDQHAQFADQIANTRLKANAELSWPLGRKAHFGTDLIVPKIQYSIGQTNQDAVPNQDSTRVEFDQGNLFRHSQGPGFDLAETGNAFTAGVTWNRHWNAGFDTEFTAGRIWRDSTNAGYSHSSGLDGRKSDWLLSLGFRDDNGIAFFARTLLDDDGDTAKTAAQFDLTRARYNMNAAWTYLSADTDEDRNQNVSELAASFGYKINPQWTITNNVRYDFGADEASSAGMGLRYKNECIDINLTASRRFSTNSNVQASTDYVLSIDVLGFGTQSGDTVAPPKCGI
ncbi:MAG: LPS-assembly protein LptD [Planktomarina sp.]